MEQVRLSPALREYILANINWVSSEANQHSEDPYWYYLTASADPQA